MRVGSLFPGVGLLDYGLHLAGLEHAWFAEFDPFRRSILAKRWPGVPIYDDVRAVGHGASGDDVDSGSFPCKGASTAETVLWREMARAVGELRPRYVLIENVANLLVLHNGALWREVLEDLAALGFDVEWDCLPARAFGAPHLRDRVFLIATDPSRHREGRAASEARTNGERAGACARFLAPNTAEPQGVGQSDDGRESDGRADARGVGGEAPADANERRRHWGRQATLSRPAQSRGRGLPSGCGSVDWREFGPAIRRWEEVLGRSAPEPLVRRVDDGRPRGVDRSRLSALGDGVLVQAGWLVGRHLMELEERKVAA